MGKIESELLAEQDRADQLKRTSRAMKKDAENEANSVRERAEEERRKVDLDRKVIESRRKELAKEQQQFFETKTQTMKLREEAETIVKEHEIKNMNLAAQRAEILDMRKQYEEQLKKLMLQEEDMN